MLKLKTYYPLLATTIVAGFVIAYGSQFITSSTQTSTSTPQNQICEGDQDIDSSNSSCTPPTITTLTKKKGYPYSFRIVKYNETPNPFNPSMPNITLASSTFDTGAFGLSGLIWSFVALVVLSLIGVSSSRLRRI